MPGRKTSIAVVLFLLIGTWALFTTLPGFLDPDKRSAEKKARERKWISTSPYFIDRQACRWFMLCGLHHLREDRAARRPTGDSSSTSTDSDDYWENRRLELTKRKQSSEDDSADTSSSSKESNKNRTRDIPDYVLKYAPLVHLYSGEEFWPSDIATHLQHMNITTHANTNTTTPDPDSLTTKPWTLDNLRDLNAVNGTVYLHSKQDVEQRPAWLHSADNIPTNFTSLYPPPEASSSRKPHHPHAKPAAIYAPSSLLGLPLAPRGHRPDAEGYSAAPAVLVLVDKGSGVLDAFWFFFYSYNLGQQVLGMRFGNHVGDWEHCMVRFQDGVPKGAFLSAHTGGHAYAWQALEKFNDTRPIIYSASGSHAMYATPGDHPYVLPLNLLRDQTDKGPVWDPALNQLAYFYDFAGDEEDTTFPNRRDHLDKDGRFQPPPVEVPEERDEEGEGELDYQYQHQEVLESRKKHTEADTLQPASSNPDAPTSWFHFKGCWGDNTYSLADLRQWRLFGQYHYRIGPRGPKVKRLGRSKMCTKRTCTILYERDRLSTWY